VTSVNVWRREEQSSRRFFYGARLAANGKARAK